MKERAKSGKVVTRPTDKSHKLCISTMENYREQGRPHTEGDRIVKWEEIGDRQTIYNTTARALTMIFRIGESRGDLNRERVMDTYSTDTVAIPPLAMMPKDHKVVVGSVPAVRPVCLCTSTVNLRPSDILSEVLCPIAREEGRHIESKSTEESIYYVDKGRD